MNMKDRVYLENAMLIKLHEYLEVFASEFPVPIYKLFPKVYEHSSLFLLYVLLSDRLANVK